LLYNKEHTITLDLRKGGIGTMTDDRVIERITEAVDLLVRGDPIRAKATIRTIDVLALRRSRARRRYEVASAVEGRGRGLRVKKVSVPESTKQRVFARDNYTCCYCGRKTIDVAIFKAISQVLPDVFPYHKNWAFDRCHFLYWTHTTSLEHVLPLARGGPNDESNMRAACYECQDAKSDARVEWLGWKPKPIPAGETGWVGLRDRLPALKIVLHIEKLRRAIEDKRAG
jgi:5-methylcytosine-specific restriction endonuclease McrA